MPVVVQLPAGRHLTVRAAADAFLDTLPNTVRASAAGGKIALRLGEHRPLATVTDDEIGEALEALWGGPAVNTWNARRAAVLSWLAWCRDRGQAAPAVPAWAKRLAAPDSQTPARSETAIDRLIARRDVGLRERTLYRLLFETAARAEEILALNIEDEGICGQATPIPCDGRSRGSDNTAKPSSQYETGFSNG